MLSSSASLSFLLQSTSRSSLPEPPSKRRAVSEGVRKINTPAPATASLLYDDDITPRYLLRGILQTGECCHITVRVCGSAFLLLTSGKMDVLLYAHHGHIRAHCKVIFVFVALLSPLIGQSRRHPFWFRTGQSRRSQSCPPQTPVFTATAQGMLTDKDDILRGALRTHSPLHYWCGD